MDSLINEVGHQQDNSQPQFQQVPSLPQFNNLTKQEKAERRLLRHFMNDKDVFLNYHQSLQTEDFTNQFLSVYLMFYVSFTQKMIRSILVMCYNTSIPMKLKKH